MRYEFIIDLDEGTSIDYVVGKLSMHGKVIDIKNVKENRTSQQRKALWLWCGQCAEAMNKKNFDMRAIIRKDVEIAWSKDSFMEYIFRPLMKVKFNKKSTNKLLKIGEMDEIIDIIVKLISERTGGNVEVPQFPSFDNMLIE